MFNDNLNASKNQFFPEIEPFNHFMINVGDGHDIYVEQCGNPQGQPVVFLHGGPGGGCGANDRRFFDPKRYHIILFDQRGCGRSLPHGSLEQNDTQNLVADIEIIRNHLSINKWHVFGGSWGSTLSLVYAQTHPEKCLSLVLRGIFLARPENAHWLFGGGGAAEIFPDYWQAYTDILKQYIGTEPVSIKAAYNVMVGDDKEAAMAVAKAWTKWEISCCTLLPNPEYVSDTEDDALCWSMSRHESHYMMSDCFLKPNQIIDDCHKIKHLPISIVHGRYDIVCTAENAHTLVKYLPNANLVFSPNAGHASADGDNKHNLIEATNRMLNL